MESRNNVRERCEALEQQREPLKRPTQALAGHTRPVERRHWWCLPWCVAVVATLGFALAFPFTVQAKTFHCGAGDVQCLIDTINAANANGEKNTIRLAAGTYTLTAVDNNTDGPNGLPSITSPLTLTIIGQGAETTIIERGAGVPLFRILQVASAGTLTLKRLTIRGGSSSLAGGGIANSGMLALRDTTVANNMAQRGGGLFIDGGTVMIAHSIIAGNSAALGGMGLWIRQGTVTLLATTVTRNSTVGGDGPAVLISPVGGGDPPPFVIITDSTIDHNTAGGGGTQGGGIGNFGGTAVITNTTIAANITGPAGPVGGGIANSGTVLLTNSTLAENRANNVSGTGRGGGLFNTGTALLVNTILARNTAGLEPDCSGTITSLGTNLIGDPTGCTILLRPSDLTGDPSLAAFTETGRPGQGHFPLLPTSQAIDAGNDAVCPRTDQLGRRRIGPCDIGAIEFRDRDDRQHDEEDDQHDGDPATAAD